MAPAETYSRKCYIVVCAGCDGLFDSVRSDQITCSSTCRVRAHRSGRLKTISKIAEQFHVKPSGIQHAAAIQRLRPDLDELILSGSMNLGQAMPLLKIEYSKLLSNLIKAGDRQASHSAQVRTE